MNDFLPSDPLEVSLRQVMGKVEGGYLEAVASGVAEPTLLILDLRDRQARAIAEIGADSRYVRRFVKKGRRLGKRPDLVISLSRSAAAAAIATQYPAVGTNLAGSSARRGYLAVVVAWGCCQIFEIRDTSRSGSPNADRPWLMN